MIWLSYGVSFLTIGKASCFRHRDEVLRAETHQWYLDLSLVPESKKCKLKRETNSWLNLDLGCTRILFRYFLVFTVVCIDFIIKFKLNFKWLLVWLFLFVCFGVIPDRKHTNKVLTDLLLGNHLQELYTQPASPISCQFYLPFYFSFLKIPII